MFKIRRKLFLEPIQKQIKSLGLLQSALKVRKSQKTEYKARIP